MVGLSDNRQRDLKGVTIENQPKLTAVGFTAPIDSIIVGFIAIDCVAPICLRTWTMEVLHSLTRRAHDRRIGTTRSCSYQWRQYPKDFSKRPKLSIMVI